MITPVALRISPAMFSVVTISPQASILAQLRLGQSEAMTLALSACDSLRLTFRFRGLCRVLSGDAAEYRAVGEAGSARVIEVEDSPGELPRREEARYRLAVGGNDLRVGVDAQPAKGEGDPAGDRVGLEGRRVESVRPVRLVHGETRRAAPVLDVGIERDFGADRGVVASDLLQRGARVDVVELLDQLLERVCARLGHLLDAVLVAKQVRHFLVEHLPGELPGLAEHDSSVLGVGVVAEVRALVDEAPAFGVEVDSEGIRVLLELVADREIAELGRVALPGDRVAARPVAGGRGADV